MTNPMPWKRAAGAAGLVAAGLVAGGILAGTISASADTGTAPASRDGSSSESVDLSQPQRSEEELLTGDTLASVEEAVLAEYPGATIERTETDSDGVYESHIVTADGEHVIVQVDDNFAVTGTLTGGGHHGRGGDDRADDGEGGTGGA